jgi:hypothetical protein
MLCMRVSVRVCVCVQAMYCMFRQYAVCADNILYAQARATMCKSVCVLRMRVRVYVHTCGGVAGECW